MKKIFANQLAAVVLIAFEYLLFTHLGFSAMEGVLTVSAASLFLTVFPPPSEKVPSRLFRVIVFFLPTIALTKFLFTNPLYYIGAMSLGAVIVSLAIFLCADKGEIKSQNLLWIAPSSGLQIFLSLTIIEIFHHLGW